MLVPKINNVDSFAAVAGKLKISFPSLHSVFILQVGLAAGGVFGVYIAQNYKVTPWCAHSSHYTCYSMIV